MATYARARAHPSGKGPVNQKMGSRGGSEKKKRKLKIILIGDAVKQIPLSGISNHIAELSTVFLYIHTFTILLGRIHIIAAPEYKL